MIDCKCEMGMVQNSLNGSAFAIIFLQAELPGAAVLHMLFCISDVSFNIGLWLMNSWTKFFSFRVEIW